MEIQTQDMSRRNFVKGASALAAAAMATAPVAALADEAAAEAEDPFDKLQEENSVDGGTEAETVNATPAHRWQSEAAAAWRTPKPTVDESLVTDGGTYDVVIVGGGQAGTWAARSCAKNGLSVAVIEGQPEDAMQYIGGEVGTINNPWALEHGATETDGQDFIREVYRRNAGRSNQRFIKDYVEHSGALLQEVIEEMGADWVEENSHVGSCPPSELMVSDPSGFKYYTGTVIFRPPSMIREAWAWNDVMHKMAQDSRDNGAVWFYSTHAEYLEKDDSGRVVSVIAKNVDDESYQRLTGTKAIVLSGGDFGGNANMLRDINDEYRNLAESLGDIELAATMPIFYERDGSAIAMGVWAGGHIEVGPHAGMNTGQVTISAPWGPGSPLLNQKGLRFCDECAGGAEGAGYMAPRQPKGSIVSIADANWQNIVYTMPPATAPSTMRTPTTGPCCATPCPKSSPATRPARPTTRTIPTRCTAPRPSRSSSTCSVCGTTRRRKPPLPRSSAIRSIARLARTPTSPRIRACSQPASSTPRRSTRPSPRAPVSRPACARPADSASTPLTASSTPTSSPSPACSPWATRAATASSCSTPRRSPA